MKKVCSVVLALLLTASFAAAQSKAPLKIAVDKDQKTKQVVKQQSHTTQSGNMTYVSPQVTERNREIVLNIKLQNLGATPMPGLVVKYTLFGRDKESRAIRPAGSGEKTVEIKSLETKIVQTEPVDFGSQDVNFNQGQFGNLNRATGNEYHGIAVTVFVGEDKVASYFNPPALEKMIEKLGEESKGKTEK